MREKVAHGKNYLNYGDRLHKMEEQVRQTLSSIGLNKNEIKVYLDLNKKNNSSALDISKRTKIHRSNTYDALRNLMSKGFVKQTKKDNKMIFSAIDPEKLKDYIKQKQKDLEDVIPKIKQLAQEKTKTEDISISRGVFSLRDALNELLEYKENILVYGAPKEASEIFGEGFIQDYHKRRAKKKIHMCHIYNQNAEERIKELNKIPYTEARHLAKKYDSIVSTVISGDIVFFFIFSEPISVIRIQNSSIAESYKKYFKILWKIAKKN